MDDEDTVVGPAPFADTEQMAAQMFEDTGVVIIDRPIDPAPSDFLVVTFRVRASTAEDWPPPPRAPARIVPKRAAVYAVARPDTI